MCRECTLDHCRLHASNLEPAQCAFWASVVVEDETVERENLTVELLKDKPGV